MFDRFLVLPRQKRVAMANGHITYDSIIAQIRKPEFYLVWKLPDEFDGRFELLLYHLSMVLFALVDGRSGEEPHGFHGDSLSQRLFDIFCQDIEDIFRDSGITDFAIPRRMKKVAEAFYGRSAAYRQSIATKNRDNLARSLARNMWRSDDKTTSGATMAADYGLDTIAIWQKDGLWYDSSTAVNWPLTPRPPQRPSPLAN